VATTVDVPRNLKKVKTKFAFGMTKRQLLCFVGAGAIGLVFYWLTHRTIGTTLALTGMILILLPILFVANYEKDGRFIEDIVKDIIYVKFKNPGLRLYESQNTYAWLRDRIYEKEVLGVGIVQKNKGNSSGRKPGKETGRTHRTKE
jgi:hypothetical protein